MPIIVAKTVQAHAPEALRVALVSFDLAGRQVITKTLATLE